MKKILCIMLVLLVLSGCETSEKEVLYDKYKTIIDALENDNFEGAHESINNIKDEKMKEEANKFDELVDKETGGISFNDVLEIPNSKLIVDDEGRDILEIELTLENINYLRKYKSITNEYIDEFGDYVIETNEGYYSSLYDHGYRLFRCTDFASKIDNEMIGGSRPTVIWNERATITKIKGKLEFCKFEDYDSFGLAGSECTYYMCTSVDGACIAPSNAYDEDFPY